MFWLQSGKDGCYVKSGLSLDWETGFSAIMHKKIIPVFSPRIFPCIKIHIASRLRDLQSYHFDKTMNIIWKVVLIDWSMKAIKIPRYIKLQNKIRFVLLAFQNVKIYIFDFYILKYLSKATQPIINRRESNCQYQKYYMKCIC